MTGCPLLDSEYASRQNGKRLPCERLAEENERLRTQVNQLEGQCYGMDGMSASAKIRTLQRMNVLLREQNGRLQIESGKLRELMRDMWQFTGTACKKYPRLFDQSAQGGQMVMPNMLGSFEQRMRELGVDV